MKTNMKFLAILKNSLPIYLIGIIFMINPSVTFSQNTYATATSLGTLTCAGSPYTNIASGTTVGAGNDCGNASADRWYSFTIATTSDVTISLCSSSYDTYLRLYNSGAANCGAATQINFNDDACSLQSSITQVGLAAGTYIIMIEGYSSSEGNYQLDISLSNCAVPTAMSYVSSTTTQANTSNIEKCSLDNREIIGVQVVTTGTLTPIDLTSLRIRTNGSTNPLADISNIDVYYTGTSSTFATTTFFGNAAPAAVGTNININGTQTLVTGINYFWVVYDLNAGATSGNVLDALCNRIVVNATNQIPTVTTPAGNRTIADCPGDAPCGAIAITVGCSGSKILGDNTGMTNSGIAAPSCGTYAGGDVWYNLTVPASGTVKVETYAGTLSDVAMAIYTASGGCGGALTQITCDDNSGFGNMSKATLTGQTPGNTLYVRVWDNNNNQTGTFEIDAADLSSDYCVTGNGIDQGSGCAQLTAAVNGQLGSIWDADDKLDFTSDWTYDFTVNLGNSDAGADGVCFVIQNDPAGLNASGTPGGAMGAGGITNSLIVEIDTYLNTEDRDDGMTGVLCSGGPDPDHLDIWLNGNVNPFADCSWQPPGARIIPNAVRLMNGASLYNIENGLDHTLRISYNSGSQTLTATVLNAAATITYGTVSYSPINPMTLFGTNAPYFGFTASTGGLNNQQSACLAASLILPITLADFTVDCNAGEVKLKWSTASEINNNYFTIERSTNGKDFEIVGTVNGAGNSSTIKNYLWIDESPLPVTAYYRLKQTDFNGDLSYSNVLASSCQSNNNIVIYPNPAHGTFSFNYNSDKHENLTVELFNMAGQLILRKDFNELPLGYSEHNININDISNGIYYVKFSSANNQFTQKFSIVN